MPRFVLAPDQINLLVSPVPDTGYTLVFDYWQTPQRLSGDSDIPSMPAHFHDMIVHLALTKYAAFDDAPEIMEQAMATYKTLYRELYREQAAITRKTMRMRPLA
jgi:hypothetical protein